MQDYDDEELEAAESGAIGDEDDYGSCPLCGSPGEMLNHGRHQWMVCHQHKVKWHVGVGFFSALLRPRKEEWDQAGRILAGYRQVEPGAGSAGTDQNQSELARFRRLIQD